MEVVVEAEVDMGVVVALLVEAVAMMVIEPTPAASGRVMMLRCLQRLPRMVTSGNTRKSGAWFANLAGGTPLIPLDITFPFLPLIFSGLNQGRLLLREAVVDL
jgi:hypothetical protein